MPDLPPAPLARAYLPMVSRRHAAILNSAPRANAAEPGSVHYVTDPAPPDGATGAAWDLFTEAAVVRYRRLGAILVYRRLGAIPAAAPSEVSRRASERASFPSDRCSS